MGNPGSKPLNIRVDACGFRMAKCMIEQHAEIRRSAEIVLLPIAEEFSIALRHQPAEICSPSKPFRLNHEFETRIAGVLGTGFSRALIRPVYRNEHMEVLEFLVANGSKCFLDQIPTTEYR